jgi:hypothetical protein
MNIETLFDIRDKVKIKETKHDGRIISIWIVSTGVTYETRYFNSGKLEKEYFYEDEIELMGDKK